MRLSTGLKGLPIGLVFAFTAWSSFAVDGLLGCPVTLAWDASPDANVTGYALYYGVEGSGDTNRVDAGPALAVTLTNLYASSNYFFVAVSYNELGIESIPSGPVLYSPPAITRLRISRLPGGSAVLRFRSAAGSQCRVEYSPTLSSNQWRTLAATNADAGGNVVIKDSSLGRPASRYYRAVR